MKRPANNAVSKAIVALLRGKITDIPITDHIDEDVSLPYISVGYISTSDTQDNAETVSVVKAQLHIWSEYKGKAQVDLIGARVIEALQAEDTVFDMSADSFVCAGGDIDSFESYEEDIYGYNGVINMTLYVQDIAS